MKSKDDEEILLDALNALDSSIGTLMMARTVIMDRLDSGPKEGDPLSTMGGAPVDNCLHQHIQEKPLMGGKVVIRFCRDCGDQLSDDG